MLRSPVETGLNDLHVRLLETAHLYGLLAQKHTESAMAGLFGELAERRRKGAAAVEQFVRRLGGLPDVPDTDWETLEQFLAGTRQALGDEQAVVERALEHERQLAEAVQRLGSEPVSGEIRRFLDELGREIENACERLQQMPAGSSPPQ